MGSYSGRQLTMLSSICYGSVVTRRMVAFALQPETHRDIAIRVTNLIRCGLKMPSRALLGVSLLLPFVAGVCYSQQCSCNPVGSPPYGQGQCYTWSYTSCSWAPTSCQQSPIIIDTDGHGFHLTSATAGVIFDIAGNGNPVQIAWTEAGSGNAFLALDRDHNGKIDNGKELFGNNTQQPSSPDPNGFLALAEFDLPANGGNDDGLIDNKDAVSSHLLLWIDSDHDGISQANELHSLAEFGIASISLTYRESRRIDKFGNQFRDRAAINADTTTGQPKEARWAYDVFFEVLEPNTTAFLGIVGGNKQDALAGSLSSQAQSIQRCAFRRRSR
jgi:hypothetical protein